MDTESEAPLHQSVQLVTSLLDHAVSERCGFATVDLVRRLRAAGVELRDGTFKGGRDAFSQLFKTLTPVEAEQVGHTFTQLFHLLNSVEEQHRISVLRARDRAGETVQGSITESVQNLKASPDRIREVLSRLFVMPVLTAHPTEARRSTVLDHLEEIARGLESWNDPRPGEQERRELLASLKEDVLALSATPDVRPARPTPLDEIRAGLQVFERTLFDVTPTVIRSLEDALTRAFPNENFEVPPFLRWGTWIGGDRDGNPFVTAEVTRVALERQRTAAIRSLQRDARMLGRELSVTAVGLPIPEALNQSLELERERQPEIAARARRARGYEPWREKIWFMQARLDGALRRGEGGYADVKEYLADLALLRSSLQERGLKTLAQGRIKDAVRRAESFGFHTATMDLRQHSATHEAAVAELLAQGGKHDYRKLEEAQRVQLLSELLERSSLPTHGKLSPETTEALTTLTVVGRARRDMGNAACERYVVSFTRSVSDLLEVLFLARSAGLAPTELRPVPLLEQLEDLQNAQQIANGLLSIRPLRAAIGQELEVMVGYSDSGKQVGYVPSSVALVKAQESLAEVAKGEGVVLTIFHGRGGAVGRGGGPSNRAIKAQPPEALQGRLRLTEQGETIAARYARPALARRDLEQMVSAVLAASVDLPKPPPADQIRRRELVQKGADAALTAYRQLVSDSDRLAAYVVQATPIREISQMRIGSRPASRSASPKLEDLRAIPWVFCWNQSRQGIPGWFGLGTALEAIINAEGLAAAQVLYAQWPFFKGMLDNAQLALARADIDVARQYAQLADEKTRGLFALILAEHTKTTQFLLQVIQQKALLDQWPTLANTVRRRNPFVDVLSHLQVELLRRLRSVTVEDQEKLRPALFTTIQGIAAGLQTAG
ncbi:MAG: phosphoenolpyruvate carboxylase [Myxococcaceae bacterium]